MRQVLLLCCSVFFLKASSQQLADYVNPFIGATTSTDAAGIYHGLGKTFPGATTPYGMVQVSPNTITGGDNAPGYSYEHKTIEGFAFTQMSGVGWFGDLGNFLVMPTAGELHTYSGKEGKTGKGYRSFYDKKSEKASAGYYSVKLADFNIKTETTATPHCGMLRFTFSQNNESRIQIDLARRVGGTSTSQYVKVVDDHTIQGWMKCTPDGGGWGNGDGHADYIVYFYAQFSKPLKDYGVWSADIKDGWSRKREDIEKPEYVAAIAEARVTKEVKEMEGKHLGFFTNFSTTDNEVVQMKAGISFVSIDGAKKNVSTEIADWNFEGIRAKAKQLWNDALAKVTIDEKTPADRKNVFYTALYHTMIDPRMMQDVDGNYPGADGKMHSNAGFTKRTVFSGWDVFRSQMPLQTIINPTLVNDLVNSLVTMADESGKQYLERWELANAYTGCMIGNPAVSVLADAYAKGIRNYDADKAYQYAVNTVEKFGNGDKGYTGEPFSISNTLEYAYTDWCVGQLAKALNKNEDVVKYNQRGMAYQNIFDKEKGWFRPKKNDGTWEAWPAEGRLKQWYGGIECNPYQQGWFVPQDVDGMFSLMGGKQKVAADLTQFFEKTPKDFGWNDYYNHANEPVHHVPFLFNRAGAPWLTQYWTRIITENAYHNTVEGLVGNEDAGQMSAWYVLAAAGIHPICPGSTRYEISSPLFRELRFAVGNNATSKKTFVVKANSNTTTNKYIQKATLNGKPYNKCFLNYPDIMAGGMLELWMGPQPNKNWGAEE